MIKIYKRLLLLGLVLTTSAILGGCADYGNVPPGMYVFGIMPGPVRENEGHRHSYDQYRRGRAHNENAPRYENRDQYYQGQGSGGHSRYNNDQRYRQHGQNVQVQGPRYPDQNSQIKGPRNSDQNNRILNNQMRSRDHQRNGNQLRAQYGVGRALKGYRKPYGHQVQRQHVRYRHKQHHHRGVHNDQGKKNQNHNQHMSGQAG